MGGTFPHICNQCKAFEQMLSLLLCLLGASGSPLYAQSPAEVDAYLPALHESRQTFSEALRQVLLDSVGTPYHDGPLGEGPGAPYDADPIIDLSRADCVTFVEQSVALAMARDYASATAGLQQLRYAGGKVDYAQRNHFMIADWIPNNTWCRDISDTLGVPTATVTRTISKADFFRKVKAPDVGQAIPDRDVTVTYVPIAQAPGIVAALDKPALIIFIGHVDWLFALHCGIYVPPADGSGPGALYHASSKAGKVAAMDLVAYAAEQSRRYLGFTVYEITPPVF